MGAPAKEYPLDRPLKKKRVQLFKLRGWVLVLLALDLLIECVSAYFDFISVPGYFVETSNIFEMTALNLICIVVLVTMKPANLITVLGKLISGLMTALFYGRRFYFAEEWHFYYFKFAMLTNIVLAVVLMAFWALYLAFLIDFNRFTKINNFPRLFLSFRFLSSKESNNLQE